MITMGLSPRRTAVGRSVPVYLEGPLPRWATGAGVGAREEVGDRKVVVAMKFDADLLGGGEGGVVAIHLGGVDAHGQGGEERAQHKGAVGGLGGAAARRRGGHRPAVDAEVQRMIF